MAAQRVVVGLLGGFGPEYLAKSAMPELKRMARDGFAKEVQAILPAVTGVNDVSICRGAWPDEHGATLFERAASRGVRSALLTCRPDTAGLLRRGATLAVVAEAPRRDVVDRHGPPPSVRSAAVTHWIWRVAIDLLRTRPELGVVYVQTADDPMHRWAPEEPESRDHLARLDALLGEARDTAPDAAFLFTADHGMNAKKRCWDLARVCEEEGVPLRLAASPERDPHPVHRRNLSGCASLWLRSPASGARVREVVGALEGVEEVLDRSEAARRFRHPHGRIGDLTVLGDARTAFGEMEWCGEKLSGCRAHGSLHESRVPLIVHGAEGAPPRHRFEVNLDLTRWLFPVERSLAAAS